jgi:hypothetical protein
MENNQERRDLTISEDLHHILNVLKPHDAEAVLALKEELADNWNKRQIFRTETEMRISVLNDGVCPTPATKYWQSVREMGAHFDALMSLTFDLRRNEVKRLRLEKELKEADKEGDNLKKVELEIDLDENLYNKAAMTQVAHDRVRELQTWSKIKNELADGSFDTQDVNKHQAESFRHVLENRVASLNAQSNASEVVNAVGPLETLKRLTRQGGTLADFDESRKQLK